MLTATDLFAPTDAQFLIAVPRSDVPVAFTCSQRCANEQAQYNVIRQRKLLQVQDADRRIEQQHPRYQDAYSHAMATEAPDSVLSYRTNVLMPNVQPNTDLFFGDDIVPFPEFPAQGADGVSDPIDTFMTPF